MWTRNHFLDVRLGIDARINPAFMIGCTYKSERTLALSFIYSRFGLCTFNSQFDSGKNDVRMDDDTGDSGGNMGRGGYGSY